MVEKEGGSIAMAQDRKRASRELVDELISYTAALAASTESHYPTEEQIRRREELRGKVLELLPSGETPKTKDGAFGDVKIFEDFIDEAFEPKPARCMKIDKYEGMVIESGHPRRGVRCGYRHDASVKE